jgi:TorA maturation chaperone TorD
MPTPSDLSLAGSVLCRALKLGVRYPGAELRQALFSPEGGQVLVQAAMLWDGAAVGSIRKAVEGLLSWRAGSEERLEDSYRVLFGPTLRGRACPYETEYGESPLFRQTQELADISGYYRAFGLGPGRDEAERVDHVGCEFEYVEFLFLKEAYALEHHNEEMLGITRGALLSFLRDHLGRFGCAFAASLEREDPGDFYRRLGGVCRAFLESACTRLGVPVGPRFLELRSFEEDGVPMACGEGDGSSRLLSIQQRTDR